MPFEEYSPEFKTVADTRQLLVENGYFSAEDLSNREIQLALEVLHTKHHIGKGGIGYEITEKHLPVLTQYIDRQTPINCDIDIA